MAELPVRNLSGGNGRYRRHQPELTLLYELVEQHYPEFEALMRSICSRPTALFPGTSPGFATCLVPAVSGFTHENPSGSASTPHLLAQDVLGVYRLFFLSVTGLVDGEFSEVANTIGAIYFSEAFARAWWRQVRTLAQQEKPS